MSVNAAVTLPAQPTQGTSVYEALGGDGRQAPHGCYFCTLEVAGDATGGVASMTITFDVRYTNLVAYMNLGIEADAGAGDFMLRLQGAANAFPPRPQIVGTIPQVASTLTADNAEFLWYPPPVFFQQQGIATASVPNVGVNETYKLQIEILVFDPDVRRLAPLPWLMLNVPGVSAPAAI